MSFGGPPQSILKTTPPDRGSFPLDHEGECKDFMSRYLDCLHENKGSNTTCKLLSKNYLECRMQKKLMDRDEWENLGFHEEKKAPPDSASGGKGAAASGDAQSIKAQVKN